VLVDEVVHQCVAQRYQVFEVGLGLGVVLRRQAQLHARAKGDHVAGKIVVAFLAAISIGDDIRTKQLSDQRAQGLGRGIFNPRCANGLQRMRRA